MNQERIVNWGILGPGRIAHTFAQGCQATMGSKIYAVASRDAARAESFAAWYQIPKVYTDYQDMLDDPQVDMVYVATPHRFHHEQVLLCLQAGKSVLCEKPLTVNALQAEELIKTAKERNAFLMEALWTRFLPIYGVIHKWLNGGIIGKIWLMRSTFGYQASKDPAERWFNPELAGGSLLDLGVYNINISQWVMGKAPDSFQVYGQLAESGVDEMIAAMLWYKDGTVSQFSCNFVTNDINDFTIYGEYGNIRIHPGFHAASTATLVTENEELTIKNPIKASGFEYEIEEAMQCYLNGKLESPIMPLAQTLQNMELMDGIRRQLGVVYPFE
jgi:dihydrodiol dehydrogenase / D-xylose 1-dehydrogenase (NADP)